MGLSRVLIPLVGVAGVFLAVGSAKAKAKKKKIDQAFDLGLDDCMTSEETLAKFADDTGYHVYYFKTPADKQPPKPGFTADPLARAFDASDCRFERWNGSAWVPDDATNDQLDQWLSENTPPEPPSSTRAVPSQPITSTLFQTWWEQTEFGQAGVPGFWINEFHDPPSGLDFIGPFPIIGLQPNPNVAIATNDGALWYWDNGWHPAPKLSEMYDEWYAQSH